MGRAAHPWRGRRPAVSSVPRETPELSSHLTDEAIACSEHLAAKSNTTVAGVLERATRPYSDQAGTVLR